jgi:transposase
MDTNSLFGRALGLGDGWKVINSEMDVASQRLSLSLDFAAGSYFACPQCGEFCRVHDTVEKVWRHLDFWQHQTELVARVPRIVCDEHGVLQTEVPWARTGSGFTLMMEAMVLLLCQQMPVTAVAVHLGETDPRLWRILDHYVTKAHAAEDWSGVRRVMIDETSTKKGHHYATNFMDADTRKLLFTVPGKDQETMRAFAEEMVRHNAHSGQVTEFIMDMSTSFIAGAQRFFPGARVIFDHFHVMQLVGKAVDAVRQGLVASGADLAGGMWAIRGNEWTRSEKQQADRRRFIKAYPILGRAIGLRESLQDILAENDPEMLKWWCGWASRSRLKPFEKLAKSIKNHWAGILAFMETRLTNAAMEAVNGVLQLAKRMARGFRNFSYFRIMAYLKAGRLQLNIPQI